MFLCVGLDWGHIDTGSAASIPHHRPTVATPQATYTVVNVAPVDVLNLRARPEVASSVIGKIPPYGLGIHVCKAGGQALTSTWMPICYKGISGWANSRYLARQVGSIDELVSKRAGRIIWALKQKDMETLSQLAHPDKGVRFSPYSYVRSEDLVFYAADIRNLMSDQAVHSWGYFDGTGHPINLTFDAYFKRFIHNTELSHPQQVGCNTAIGRGNTINNIATFYPNAIFVEYYFAGMPPLQSEMGWRSLRLILEEQKGAWYLVGIVNDEWTI